MRRHGVSILELLIAGAVLLFALVGIVALVMRGAYSGREGEMAASASNVASESLADIQGRGFDTLAVGVFDGGTVHDLSGRRFGRIVTVTGDDGGYPTFNVEVAVEYPSPEPPPFQQQLRTTVSMQISRTPDAN